MAVYGDATDHTSNDAAVAQFLVTPISLLADVLVWPELRPRVWEQSRLTVDTAAIEFFVDAIVDLAGPILRRGGGESVNAGRWAGRPSAPNGSSTCEGFSRPRRGRRAGEPHLMAVHVEACMSSARGIASSMKEPERSWPE